MTLPAWVYKRDGRLVPFEPDRIHRALFLASEALGEPDAFLSRELADGVLHFLAVENETGIPTTAQVSELIEKVVRELGQPELAQAFASMAERRKEPKPADVAQDFVRESILAEMNPLDLSRSLSARLLHDFSVREVYSRDLIIAQDQGLLTVTGLNAPLELAAWVARSPRDGSWTGAIETARSVAGQWVALDSPEHVCLALHQDPAHTAKEIATALRLTGLKAIVALNMPTAPAWTSELAPGPLFGAAPEVSTHELSDALAMTLLADRTARRHLRVDWHLGDGDFSDEVRHRLVALARRALEGAPVAFVFDRPRLPLSLGEGLNRSCPGVLAMTGLHLPALLKRAAHPDEFLRRLPSLARLAVSVAVQKRDFLRRNQDRRPELAQGFLMDRARFVVVPIGLDPVARALSSDQDANLARQIVGTLCEVLAAEGKRCRMDVALDSAPDFYLTDERDPSRVAGLTRWDVDADPKQQLKFSGALHHAARAGTALLLLKRDDAVGPEKLAGLLQWCWKQTDVYRLRIHRDSALPEHQPGLWH